MHIHSRSSGMWVNLKSPGEHLWPHLALACTVHHPEVSPCFSMTRNKQYVSQTTLPSERIIQTHIFKAYVFLFLRYWKSHWGSKTVTQEEEPRPFVNSQTWLRNTLQESRRTGVPASLSLARASALLFFLPPPSLSFPPPFLPSFPSFRISFVPNQCCFLCQRGCTVYSNKIPVLGAYKMMA